MNTNLLSYFNAMGIQAWQLKTQSVAPPLQNDAEDNAWQTLHTAVVNCTACDLCQTRTQIVFGVGNHNADLMIVGEAPGFYEDKQGEPFVGRAGQLLNAMIKSIGFEREQIYIANILKCRPPNNRDPLPAEVNLCTPFLQKQIALIKPKVLLAVGRIAAHYLLNTQSSMTEMRGKIHHYGVHNTPLVITYHPAYLLRTPSDKAKAFQDLQRVSQLLRILSST